MATWQLEQFRVLPGAASAGLSLPLTFLDIHWFPFHPIQRLMFYEFHCSKAHFLETLIPELKRSLSLTLTHYLPLAGNLVCPLTSGIPRSRYVIGDSVSLTVAESASDFGHLIGCQARDTDEFHQFSPRLPPPKKETGYKIVPVLAVQVTLFSDRGVCIGVTNHHVIGDASSIVKFIMDWALIHKFNGDSRLIEAKLLPGYDERQTIKDESGIDAIFWDQAKKFVLQQDYQSLEHIPTFKVRSTYIMHPHHIQKLKNHVLSRRPSITHASSFVVTTAYVWECMVKCLAATENIAEEEPYYFGFPVDCRARLNPPLPAAYFGNCLSIILVKTVNSALKGSEGFLMAAELIGEAIHNEVCKEDILDGAENWLVEFESLFGCRVFGVAGSPKFDLYSVDFGWGGPRKHESLSIDRDGSMSLSKSRDFDGSLEVGLSLPKAQMDAFAPLFINGLENL